MGEHNVKSVVEAMADVAGFEAAGGGVEETLPLVTQAACANLAGVDYASVTIRYPDGRLETLAPTHEVTVQADKLQYTYREGPCFEAVEEDLPVLSDDLANDRRWPRFGADAADLGLGSLFALEIYRNEESHGALNLYSRGKHAFEGEHDLVRLFGSYAAAILGYAAEVNQLHRALETRGEIGRAVGIVMERYGLNEERAFEFLIRLSQTGNVKLHAVAHNIVDSANTANQANSAKRAEPNEELPVGS
jgi:ANTAR domain/GAF domain